MKLKRTISILLIIITMATLTLPVYALGVTSEVTATYETPTPLWEETQWVFRFNNGVLEQRLWSITFGRWLNDWHPVNS